MPRAAARVNHDEMVRALKAAQSAGLCVSGMKIEPDGAFHVICGDSGEVPTPVIDPSNSKANQLPEPRL